MIKFAILEIKGKTATLMKVDCFICYYPYKENEFSPEKKLHKRVIMSLHFQKV